MAWAILQSGGSILDIPIGDFETLASSPAKDVKIFLSNLFPQHPGRMDWLAVVRVLAKLRLNGFGPLDIPAGEYTCLRTLLRDETGKLVNDAIAQAELRGSTTETWFLKRFRRVLRNKEIV